MVGLVENMSEIAKVTNYRARSLASDEEDWCQSRRLSAEIAVKSTGFREIVAHDCYHICFPKSCCVGKHALLVLLVGGWGQIWPWQCGRRSGGSFLWPYHWEMLWASLPVRLPRHPVVAFIFWVRRLCQMCPCIGQTACFKQWQAFGRSPQ